LTLAAVVATGALEACSSSSSKANPGSSAAPSGAQSSAAPPVSSSAAASTITVLVTNDDGVSAPGIDALVQALRKVSGVTVKVVAPATNQSGTGGKTTAGTVTFTNATTASGYPAVSVNGTPADSVNVAFSRLHLAPNVVISGVNAGQNLGPVVDLSGTVGAARVGARMGLPALAVSSGAGKAFDFASGARYAVKWLASVRATLPQGPSSTPASVVSLNVPSCTKGQIRGELTLKLQPKLLAGQSILGGSNCLSKLRPAAEVAAFTDGFATLVAVPLNPAS
jgi:5'-nucleotidase